MPPLEELVARCQAERRDRDVSALIRRLDNLLGAEVAHAARRFRVDREDLRQEAVVGLLSGLDRFDPTKGAFLSHARTWIRAALYRFGERQSETLSRPNSRAELWLSRHAGRRWRQISAERPELLSREACAIIAEECRAATGIGVNADRVEAAMALAMPRGCAEELARVEAPASDAPEDMSGLLEKAIAALPDREQRVIRARFRTGAVVSLDEIADEMETTREAVRKVMLRGLEMLRETLGVQGLDDAAL